MKRGLRLPWIIHVSKSHFAPMRGIFWDTQRSGGETWFFVKSKTSWLGKNPTCGKKSPFLGVLRETETAL